MILEGGEGGRGWGGGGGGDWEISKGTEFCEFITGEIFLNCLKIFSFF